MILNPSSCILTIDSRVGGNDGRFCKGLLDGRGIKEPVPVLDTGSEGDSKTKQPLTVILALRQYPQGGAMTLLHQDLSHQETFEKFNGTAITYADHRISQVAFSYRFPPTRE